LWCVRIKEISVGYEIDGMLEEKLLRTMHEITSRFVAQLHRVFDRFSIAKSAT